LLSAPLSSVTNPTQTTSVRGGPASAGRNPMWSRTALTLLALVLPLRVSGLPTAPQHYRELPTLPGLNAASRNVASPTAASPEAQTRVGQAATDSGPSNFLVKPLLVDKILAAELQLNRFGHKFEDPSDVAPPKIVSKKLHSDRIVTADLQLNRFGHKCEDSSRGSGGPPDLLQLGSEIESEGNASSNASIDEAADEAEFLAAAAAAKNEMQEPVDEAAPSVQDLFGANGLDLGGNEEEQPGPCVDCNETAPAATLQATDADVTRPSPEELPPAPSAPRGASLVLQDKEWQGPAQVSFTVEDPQQSSNGITGYGTVVLLALGMAAVLIPGTYIATTGLAAQTVLLTRAENSTLRKHVEALPVSGPEEVERQLPMSGGYDCKISKPLSSCQLLRLEATVIGPREGKTLTSPLSRQACVVYSAAVSRQLHDDIHPFPVAFASSSVDFVVSLLEAPHMRVNLLGGDVSLFDMKKGQRVVRRPFAGAPEHFQDFVLSHRAAPAAESGAAWPGSSAPLRADAAPLEFRECALLVGAQITIVGELHRGADGSLALRPGHRDEPAPGPTPGDWENVEKDELEEPVADAEEPAADEEPTSVPASADREVFALQVLASDDARLRQRCNVPCESPRLNVWTAKVWRKGSGNQL